MRCALTEPSMRGDPRYLQHLGREGAVDVGVAAEHDLAGLDIACEVGAPADADGLRSSRRLPCTSATPPTLKVVQSMSPLTVPAPAIMTSPYVPPVTVPAPAILVSGLFVSLIALSLSL